MPEPLEYRNPKRRDEDAPGSAKSAARPVIPIEFDVVVARTPDHAAARAIELQLKRARIQAMRSEEGDSVNRWIELRVRTPDREKASQIAGQIFARRQKLKSFPRQVVDPPPMPGDPSARSNW